MNERDIFLAALEQPTAEARSEYLSLACAGDPALQRRVESLLQIHEKTGEFLQKPLVERLVEGVAALEDAADTARDPAASSKRSVGLDSLRPSEQPGSLGRLGHYEVQEVIGSGGMGIVLRAFDERLHRMVAIKVMAAPLATNAAARKRFQREARAAAAVCHDHIVTIHAVEESDEVPYLVMQCVSGLSLQQRIDRDGPLELHEILRIGMQTAAGLAAAHAQGLIHRDIKPANILLENGVERVKITDFGLARAAADASISQSGAVIGTPQYMAPEQARGEALDGRTDLFSLGSVLYAMCTGRAPFRAASSIAVLKRVCEEAPSPIREANADIPDWLVAIIDKLHAKNPDDRYQSAAEVAEVLGQRLAQLQNSTALPPAVLLASGGRKPPDSSVPAGGFLARKRRWAFAAAAVLVLAATLGLAEGTGATKFAATVIRLLTPEGTLVVEVTDPDVKVTIDGEGGLVITGVGQHVVHLKLGSHTLQADKDGKPVPLDQELVTITRGDKPVVRVRLEGAAAPVVAAAQMPRVPRGREIRRFLGHKDLVREVAFSPKGRVALSASADGTARLWDLETGKELQRFTGHSGAVNSVAFSPDGRRALSGGSDRTTRLWEVETGKELRRFAGQYVVAFSPDGRQAISSSDEDQIIRLWDLDSGKEVRQFQGHSHYVASAVFSSDGRRILSGAGWDSRVRLWDVQSGQVVARLSGHGDGWVSAVALSPDGRRALTAMLYDHLVRFWDVEAEKELRRFQGHTGWVVSVAFSPDGRHALTASFDRTVRLWDVATGKELCRFEGHTGPVIRAVFSPDGRQVLSGSEDGTMRLWQLPEAGSGQAPQPERGEFVVLGGKGVAERKFNTLAGAVQSASDGDTIEVRGNGPFVSEPIKIRLPLTIRAGEGFRPVIKLSSEGLRADAPLLETEAALVLEGLELQRMAKDRKEGPPYQVVLAASGGTTSKDLHVANCRFLMSKTPICIHNDSSVSELRNCEFFCADNHAGAMVSLEFHQSGQRLVIDNCLLTNFARVNSQEWYKAKGGLVQLTRNTFRTRFGAFSFYRFLDKAPNPKDLDHGAKLLSIETSGNIFDASFVFQFEQDPSDKTLPTPETASHLAHTVGWVGERNLYAVDGPFAFVRSATAVEPITPGKDLVDWRRFWATAEGNSIEGRVKYQGGDLLAKLVATPEQLTSDDFRLRPDSPGYKAGKDGKDLGADVDLVGPGPAYERWKKTPEYQKWLQETRKVKP